MGTKTKAECPGCGKKFETYNNDCVNCPKCDLGFIICDEDKLTMWD